MGGHSKVVADVAKRNDFDIVGYLDDRPPKHTTACYLGGLDRVEALSEDNKAFYFFIGIGDNFTRYKIVERMKGFKLNYATLIDPSSVIGTGVSIAEGTLVMPGTVINADSYIGKHVIVNTGATVDHDCYIADFVHLSPGVHLAGGVTICTGSHLGIGCTIIPQKTVGENTVVGAGSTVINDLPANCTAVGTPAKPIKFHKQWI
jgi:sugar O-acyltransferase (sialic acid O-acetyltransferase NeuD family)